MTATAASQSDNFRDNVEKVTIISPPPGEYTIRVNHKSTIGIQYYGMVISGLSTTRPTNIWTGTSGTGWTSGANWSLGHEPVGAEKVVIPAGCPNYPVLPNNLGIGYHTGYTDLCHELTVAQGASLTINGYDLVCAGTLNNDGIIYVGDDLILNNGGVLNLNGSGSVYTGYSDGFHGYLAMNSGSTVTQSGGNLYAEELQLYSGSQYTAGAGYFHIYKQGTANASQNILIDDDDNNFYYFFIDTLIQAYLNNCTSDLNISYITRISGKLSLGSYTIHSYMMNVFGELNIATGNVDITQTGPIFFNTGTLNMFGGTLTTSNSIWFNAGSNGNMTDGILNIRRDLNNQSAEFAPQGGRVRFFGDVLSQ